MNTIWPQSSNVGDDVGDDMLLGGTTESNVKARHRVVSSDDGFAQTMQTKQHCQFVPPPIGGVLGPCAAAPASSSIDVIEDDVDVDGLGLRLPFRLR